MSDKSQTLSIVRVDAFGEAHLCRRGPASGEWISNCGQLAGHFRKRETNEHVELCATCAAAEADLIAEALAS